MREVEQKHPHPSTEPPIRPSIEKIRGDIQGQIAAMPEVRFCLRALAARGLSAERVLKYAATLVLLDLTEGWQAGDAAWVQRLRDEQAARFKAEVLRRVEMMPSGQRIRILRSILGWTQRTAAAQLGISLRTLIRHEQGHHRTPSLRLPLLLQLRELETTHAEEIIAYLSRGGAQHT